MVPIQCLKGGDCENFLYSTSTANELPICKKPRSLISCLCMLLGRGVNNSGSLLPRLLGDVNDTGVPPSCRKRKEKDFA